jgi:hypothetical protein
MFPDYAHLLPDRTYVPAVAKLVVNFGPMAPSLRTGLASLMPFNRVVRSLKRL